MGLAGFNRARREKAKREAEQTPTAQPIRKVEIKTPKTTKKTEKKAD